MIDHRLAADQPVWAVVPAAGIGTRMQAEHPKQYLSVCGQPILALTVGLLLAHPRITKVVVALAEGDPYWPTLAIAAHPDVITAPGGRERADSVLAALKQVESPWVLVHDAARPCLQATDIDALLACAQAGSEGAILGMPVRDTMKWVSEDGRIARTVDRSQLWHALTPQLFPTRALQQALGDALAAGVKVTDEASAMEWAGWQPQMVAGCLDNIKITHPDDLRLAQLYLRSRAGR